MRITLLLTALAIMAAVLVRSSQIEDRLLRSDPNSIPADAVLMEFARVRGEALFEARCAVCHGPLGLGDTGRGIPNLSDRAWLYGTGMVSDIEQVVKYGIRSHHPKAWNLAVMPAYARPGRGNQMASLSPADVRDLVEFLVQAQGRDADAAAAGRGAELYAGGGGCYDCHAADGKGDPAIGAPDLTDRINLYGDGSRESLSMSIEYGRHGVCPAWVSRIGPAGIRELALFVHSLSHPPARPQGPARAAAPGGG